MRIFGALFSACLVACLANVGALAAETEPSLSAAERGYRLLVSKPYLPPDFDQETIDNVWKVWPEPLRSQAEEASTEQRRRMTYDRYGLTPRPDDPSKPLQYVVDDSGDGSGQWTMNCFACHGGEVAGQVVPGLPNSRFALQTLTEETRSLKLQLAKSLSRMDLGSVLVPLGSTNGTTNAVMFGVALMALRDENLNLRDPKSIPRMVHHDMDAPAWWHFKKKRHIYIDGFAEKGHRALMQFMLVKENGPHKFREWEDDFRDVYAYLESLEAPKWPYEVDESLAARGRIAFERECADCHGTYGERATWPAKTVPLDELGTDRVRLDALNGPQRGSYSASWFGHFGEKESIRQPGGYVAPPLDGVWASGPYFHNGAVPTLWHVLHPAERPTIWRREGKAFDEQRVGPVIETSEELQPETLLDPPTLRTYFDTRRFGKSNAGHDYPSALSEQEKSAVLEYLKTL
jgi:mono/diheme cytochrome c family protein